MKRLRAAGFIAVISLLAVIAAGGSAASAQTPGCANADARPGSVSNDALATALTCLMNAERHDQGLLFLLPSPKLESSERRHVDDMLENRYLGHRGTDGTLPAERARQAGYLKGAKSFVVGEDLAWGQTTAATPASIFAAWMRSPTHRRNILDPRFRQIGTIVETGSPTGAPGTAQDRNAATYGSTFGVIKRRR